MIGFGLQSLTQMIVWGLTVFMQVTFLLVAAFFVRKRHPSAAAILLIGVLLELMCSVGSFAAQFYLARVTFVGGLETYVRASSLNTLITAIGHTAGRALVIWGVVLLASEKPASAQ